MMIRLGFHTLKILIFSLIVLLIGQIPIGERRICDHVWDFTRLPIVQKPIHWISFHFDFSEGRLLVAEREKDGHSSPGTQGSANRPKRSGAGAANASSPHRHSESDHQQLSGLLKN